MFVAKNKNQKLQEAKLERRYARYLMKKINNALIVQKERILLLFPSIVCIRIILIVDVENVLRDILRSELSYIK
jgi:hypothetical protein